MVLAEPVGAGSIDVELLLVLDPEGDVEEPLPLDAVVEVTGVLTTRPPERARAPGTKAESRPDVACRFAFAVRSLHVAP